MREIRMTCFFMFMLLTVTISLTAQQARIYGKVTNSKTGDKIGSVSVFVKGSPTGTFTDASGNYSLPGVSLPATLVISFVGFETQERTFNSYGEVNIQMVPSEALGQDVVVSASRTVERILKTPVTIERISSAQLRNSPVSNFYDAIFNLKGVDVTTASLTFRTPTTRGFGGSGNPRFNQLTDGMDNQAPGLNFAVGALVGLSELDVDNMELLSGASSALYGPGGMNGTLLMTGKNPFRTPGLSFQVKTGVMHVDESERPTSPYYNWNLRWAVKASENFAFKINAELIQAQDWIGMDYRNYDRSAGMLKGGNRQTDPNYDGVNVYGDETSADLRQVLNGIAAQAPFLGGFISTLTQNPILVSRSGYTEQELLNPNTVSFKMSGAMHYKIAKNVEAILAGYFGTGTTAYTGASRYSLKDFKMGQYKLELKGTNWLLRGYTTQENAGESYNLAATTQNFNEAWKPSGGSTGWYAQYGQSYLAGRLGGLSDFDAHQIARVRADSGRPALGSAQFNQLYNQVRKIPVPKGGALLDRSDLYSVEGNYNLSSLTNGFADILVGANFRRYALNSQGTLFADTAGPISVNEWGAFMQLSKEITPSLKITASGRYDKNENFAGRFTPRVTAVYEVAKNNNIRLSYQQAYRFATNQQQFINLDLVTYKLIGGNDIFNDIYNFRNNSLYYRDSLRKGTVSQYTLNPLKAESLSSIEIGYRGLLNDGRLLIDAYGYYGTYSNFLARSIMVQSKTGGPIAQSDTILGNIYSVPINAPGKIKTYGFGLGIDYKLEGNFTIGVNLASDNLGDVPNNLITNFNSPQFKFNGYISNSGFGKDKRFGFNVTYRWQDEFYFEGDLANGTVPAVHILNAQVNYKLPVHRCMIKLGANNLLNQYYYDAIGNSRVGGLYYFGFGYNIY